MDLNNIGRDCPCYEFDNSEMSFDIGEFNGLAPNNGKLTLNVNGVEAGEFYANQQEDTTIDIQTVTQQDIDDAVSSEATIRERADRDLQANIDGERLAREQAERTLQGQIDAIASKSDVVDVVGTYAELQAYDTSKLDDNDVVKVLDDVTHNDSMTYYRWNEATQTWSYIGQESPYYSKSQTDSLLAQKQNNLTAGTGITLNGSTISADTTVLAEKSELNNYAEKANTYTKTEVNSLVEPKLSVEVVEQLPVQGEHNKLYLAEKSHTTQTATGNPITAIITDGAGQIESFQLDGDTFQQSYEGKNLFDKNNPNVLNAYFTETVETITANTLNKTLWIPCEPTTTYTIQATGSRWVRHIGYTQELPAVGVDVSEVTSMPSNATSASITTDSSARYLVFRFWHQNNSTETYQQALNSIQIEKGSSATSYEPFVGGIASPNPSYPQPIQVVTGEQTVSINGTDYPISLGSIELCKLGTYQDYIYKDGSDWKIHKETGKVDLASIAWQTYAYTLKRTDINPIADMLYVQNNQQVGVGLTEGFQIRQGAGLSGAAFLGYFAIDTNRIAFNVGQGGNDPSGNLYYALATPTDTAITDQTLIAQLNAIASASLETGTNTLTNSATGSNLAGDMEVGYFGYDPTNRYDKWLWLDINNAYEKLGS